MNRAERRRQARRRTPVIIAGANIVAGELPGHTYEARPRAELGPKIPGEHRWIAAASWRVSVELVEAATDADRLKYLDSENLLHLSLGCWDCEKPLGEIQPGSKCPAGDEWTRDQ